MDQYHFVRQIDMSREVHEHEVFISFNNDQDALDFHEWWHKQGKNSFETYVAKQERIRSGQ